MGNLTIYPPPPLVELNPEGGDDGLYEGLTPLLGNLFIYWH